MTHADQPLKRIEEVMGRVERVKLYVKRDDMLGLGGGGNKLRNWNTDGDAQRKAATPSSHGWDTVNFTVHAAACARQKIACELVWRARSADDDDYQRNGNTLLNDLFGARCTCLVKARVLPTSLGAVPKAHHARMRPYLTPAAVPIQSAPWLRAVRAGTRHPNELERA